jgi:nucleoside-diphosphate-sugar epimerase
MIVHGHAAPQKPSRVVVIGPRGFLGAALVRRLEAEGIAHATIGQREADLTSSSSVAALAAAIQPTDSVVMLSAITPDKGRDAVALARNLAMMQHVCAAIEKTGCAHFVYFSSDAVYSFATGLVSEETPPSPQDLYGVMHLARETMARGLARTPILVLRPTGVYGEGDTHNSYGPNRFRRSAEEEGKIRLFGGGEETRDHIHVDDVAAITVRCLLHRSAGVLNLATGRSLSFRDVARIVAGKSGKPVEVAGAPRANPVTHRHYDITSLIKAFPGIRLAALEDLQWRK